MAELAELEERVSEVEKKGGGSPADLCSHLPRILRKVVAPITANDMRCRHGCNQVRYKGRLEVEMSNNGDCYVDFK